MHSNAAILKISSLNTVEDDALQQESSSRRTSDRPFLNRPQTQLDLTGILEQPNDIPNINIDSLKKRHLERNLSTEANSTNEDSCCQVSPKVTQLLRLAVSPGYHVSDLQIPTYPFTMASNLSINYYIALGSDLISVVFLLRTTWVVQASLVTPGVGFLSFLGVFIPILLSILKCLHYQDFSFGVNSLTYSLYTGFKLATLYGLALTAPMIYNSARGSFSAFFIFLSTLRITSVVLEIAISLYYKTMSRKRPVSLFLDIMAAFLYIACIVTYTILPFRFDILYTIWAVGMCTDFLGYLACNLLHELERNRIHSEMKETKKPNDESESLQLQEGPQEIVSRISTPFPDSFDRLRFITVALIGLGVGHLFRERRGVGLPEIYSSAFYDVISYIYGLFGFLILFSLLRIYGSFCSDYSSTDVKANLGASKYRIPLHQVTQFLHIPLLVALSLTICGLQMTLKSIWDSALKFISSKAYHQFSLNINIYLLSIWPFLPLPTNEAQNSFLNQWVSVQKNETTNSTSQVYPPGVFQTGTSTTGTSRLTTITTSPDVLFGSSLGASFLLLSVLEISLFIMEIMPSNTNKSQSSSKVNWMRRPKIFRIIAQSILGIIICIFANLEGYSVSIEYKLIGYFALSLFQFMLTEAFRILEE